MREQNVYPLATTAINNRLLAGGVRSLGQQGIKSNDPAALAIMIKGSNDLKDHWSLRFVFSSFLVVPVTEWQNIPSCLDTCQINSTHTAIQSATPMVVLSGTADKWRTQIIYECKQGNDEERVHVFNQCYMYFLRTQLRSMFTGFKMVKHKDLFVLEGQ